MPATTRPRRKGATRYARSRRKGDVTYRPSEDDRKTVRAMITVGLDQSTICERLEITDKTLRKHFRKDLDNAHNRLVLNTRIQVINRAKTDTQALIYLSRVLGWNDRPAPANVNVNVGGLSLANMDEDAMRAELAEILTPPRGRRLTTEAEPED
jgi:hypothetical protein